MSHQDYQQSKEIALLDLPYYAMVFAAYNAQDAVRPDCAKIEEEWSTAFRRGHDIFAGTKAVTENPEFTFRSWIMALCRNADTENTLVIQRCWPDIWTEMYTRYNAPGGILRGETV